MKKGTKIVIGLIILIIAILFIGLVVSEVNDNKSQEDNTSTNATKLIVDGENFTLDNGNYLSNQANENAILVKNGGNLTLTNSEINKTGSTNEENTNNNQNLTNNENMVQSPQNPNTDNNTIPEKPEGEQQIGNEGQNPENNQAPENGGEQAGANNGQIGENGGSSNTEDSEFYGTNAAVLTLYDSLTNISNSFIETNANGANAVFATNNDSSHSGAITYIKDTEISTYQDKSRGLDATYGGIIIAENVKINTRGTSCAALATDRGEGTVNVTNSELNTGVNKTNGLGSPCIYSTGTINVNNSKGTSNVAQIACIEGKNSINIENSELNGYAQGNRESNGEYVDLGGIFIYQSMSGDALEGTAQFNSTSSTLTIPEDSDYYSSAPMFHVTNTKANITITDTTLNFGSDILLNTSGQDQWGNTGSNGGEVEFKATNEDLNGNIIIDEISSLNMVLSNSKYSGTINPSDSFGNTNLTIESNAEWTLTGDSHVNSLNNEGTIEYGDYILYVNGEAYSANNPY